MAKIKKLKSDGNCSSWDKDSNNIRSTTNGLGVMSSFMVLIAVEPPIGQNGSYLVGLSPNWDLPSGQVSSLWVLRFGLHDQFYAGRITIKILTITLGFQRFVLEHLTIFHVHLFYADFDGKLRFCSLSLDIQDQESLFFSHRIFSIQNSSIFHVHVFI